MLYIAIGILGATVMPHNLYLHSSIVQTRKYEDSVAGKTEAIRFATIDSSVALMSALFINAAILIVSAAVFHGTEYESVADIGDAHQLLSPLLGTSAAGILFAVALLCSGQNATLTGTLAGQIVAAIRRHIGVRMTVHAFRHVAAKIYLDRNPGAYALVSRLLGHRSIQTTMNAYTGLESKAAGIVYDQEILRLRDQRSGSVRRRK